MSVVVGSTLYLRPEDVLTGLDAGLYVKVTSIDSSGVTAVALESGDPLGPYTVPSRVALLRLVDSSEPTGSRTNALLREAVGCVTAGGVEFGQVVDTDSTRVLAHLVSGDQWLEVSSVLSPEHSLTSLLLFEATLPVSTWTKGSIEAGDHRLREFLQQPSDCRLPMVGDLLNLLSTGLSREASTSRYRQWRDKRTGVVQVTSVQHAIRYSFYSGSGRPVPKRIRPSVGLTIADDPLTVVPPGAPAGTPPARDRGTSPSSFVQSLLSATAVPFAPHLAVLMRLYDFGFGLRGMSIMHLVGITSEERMKLYLDPTFNSTDFSGAVKVPPRRPPSSWRDVSSAVNGLLVYCQRFTNELTVRGLGLSGFVSTMEAFGYWPAERLEALEWWINNQLSGYRECVYTDATLGTSCSEEVPGWFSPNNPSLGPVHNMVFRQTLQALQSPGLTKPSKSGSGGSVGTSGGGVGTSGGGSGNSKTSLPDNVARLVPTKDRLALCLKFASKRGCKTTSDGKCSWSKRGHFVADSLPEGVREHIASNYGGLSAAYRK